MAWFRRQRQQPQPLASVGGPAPWWGAGWPPPLGISGDLEGALDLARRQWEQSAIDASNGNGGGGGWGWFPWATEWQARQIPAVTAGMRLISGVIMQMPLRQFRGETVVDPPATIVRNPAPGANRVLADYVDEYASDVLMYGNHVALIGPPDSTGWPAAIIPIDVTQVSVAHDENWQPVYSFAGSDEYLDAAHVFHVGLDKRSGELRGRGLIPTMSAMVAASLAAEEYAGRYFDESAVPTGVITDARPTLTQQQATDMKSLWRSVVGRRREPIVLPSTTTFTPLVTDAEASQLVQARQWDAVTCAMALGIPPFMLGIETQRHTYTNAENEFGRFVRTTIMRLLAPWEQQFSLQCLPAGNQAAFDMRALLRPELLARFQAAQIGYTANLLTEAEARELMGYPAAGGPGLGPPATVTPTPAGAGVSGEPAPEAPATEGGGLAIVRPLHEREDG